jgi:hypothetical protein
VISLINTSHRAAKASARYSASSLYSVPARSASTPSNSPGHGAHVTTTISPRNFDFVRELGAAQAVDYHAAPFEDGADEFDVSFDTVGGETLQRRGGR